MLVLRKTSESGEVSTGGSGWAHLRGVRLAVCFDSYGQRDKPSPSVALSAWRVVPIRRLESPGSVDGESSRSHLQATGELRPRPASVLQRYRPAMNNDEPFRHSAWAQCGEDRATVHAWPTRCPPTSCDRPQGRFAQIQRPLPMRVQRQCVRPTRLRISLPAPAEILSDPDGHIHPLTGE
jgi:hypothetical protein